MSIFSIHIYKNLKKRSKIRKLKMLERFLYPILTRNPNLTLKMLYLNYFAWLQGPERAFWAFLKYFMTFIHVNMHFLSSYVLNYAQLPINQSINLSRWKPSYIDIILENYMNSNWANNRSYVIIKLLTWLYLILNKYIFSSWRF